MRDFLPQFHHVSPAQAPADVAQFIQGLFQKPTQGQGAEETA